MNTKDLLDRDLPKWPGHLLVGDPVTPEQAAEIIIRTNGSYIGSNDAGLELEIYEAFGFPQTPEDRTAPNGEKFTSYYVKMETASAMEEYWKMLPLEYLRNDRIATCYIDGPNGWCDWDGTIELRDGALSSKWPSMQEVYEEWKLIAAAFPYLNLRSQLFDLGICEISPRDVNVKPLIEFHVHDGDVDVLEPDSMCIRPADHSIEIKARLLFSRPAREHEFGFQTIDELKEKLEIVRQRIQVVS